MSNGTTKQIFDTGSQGTLSGTSTESASYPSPNIYARDVATQTEHPFTFRELPDRDECTTAIREPEPGEKCAPITYSRQEPDETTVYVHKNVEKDPSPEKSITSNISSGPLSAGGSSVETSYPKGDDCPCNSPNNGTEQKTIMETPSIATKETPNRSCPGIESGCDCDSWRSDRIGGNPCSSTNWGDIVQDYETVYCADCNQLVHIFK